MKGNHSDEESVLKFDMHIHTWYSYDSAVDPASVVRLWKKKRILPLICDHNSIAGSGAVFGGISDLPRYPAYPR